MRGQTGPFHRSDRLLRSREFQHVARHGRRTVVRGFVLLATVRQAGEASSGPRLGITVSRRVGGAVLRNRVKRRVREWFRGDHTELRADLDLVVIGRRAAAGLSTHEVAAELRQAARELEMDAQ